MRSQYWADTPLLATREYRRLLLWSGVGHCALAVALVWSPAFRVRAPSASPVFVSVVARMPEPPAAPAPPPRQEVDEIVIPERPKPLPKPPPEAKPKPKPKPQPAPAAPKPTLEELMSDLHSQTASRDTTREPVGTTAATGGILDPERAAYKKQVERLVAGNWTAASICSARMLFPEWQVRLRASGEVVSASLARSSGDSHCDRSAEMAILKSELPPPPGGIRVLDVSFERQ